MINFIIYSSNNDLNKKTKKVVSKFMLTNEFNYKIHIFKKYDYNFNDYRKKLIGQKIYILNSSKEDVESSLFAQNIRKDGFSINDQIIFITDNKRLLLKKCYSKIMYYDFLIIDRNYDRKLSKCISSIYYLFNQSKFLVFKTNNEIYRLPYTDINYIDKSKNEEYVSIHTKNKVYKCKNNIVYFEKKLCDGNFFKTHRSCLVNIENIYKIDVSELKIYFDDDCTNYLSRDRKKELINCFETLIFQESE